MSFFARLFGIKPKRQTRKPAEEELRAIIAQYQAVKRKASLARLSEPPASPNPLGSWFGGYGVKLPLEDIPVCGDQPMFPLLQVNCAELPYVPPALADTAILVVWINQVNMAVVDAPNGEGWLVQEYSTTEGLVPVTDMPLPKKLKTLPITWELSEAEYPHWEEAETLIDYGAIPMDLMDDYTSDELIDRYTNDEGTKIGGYPSLIQCTLERGNTFVFQIGSEQNANWNWCDAGILYFSKTNDGEWVIEDQCY